MKEMGLLKCKGQPFVFLWLYSSHTIKKQLSLPVDLSIQILENHLVRVIINGAVHKMDIGRF